LRRLHLSHILANYRLSRRTATRKHTASVIPTPVHFAAAKQMPATVSRRCDDRGDDNSSAAMRQLHPGDAGARKLCWSALSVAAETRQSLNAGRGFT